jgi:pimeloyl-ACP methyl ester carboxylesterase
MKYESIELKRIPGFSERLVASEKISINYIEGPDNGAPLILIPGQAGTWESYEKVLNPLARTFKVYAVNVRGHGKSTWTPGEYTFNNIGGDFSYFISEIVNEPAFISGNSSGGLIALWLAANKPELVRGIVLEDAPLFSADWPRIKKEFVYQVLNKTAQFLGAENGPDYIGFFKSIQRPTMDGKIRTIPNWMIRFFVWLIKMYEEPGEPLNIPWMPRRIKLFFRSISNFDPDFSRSWVDGRIYEGLDHADALSRVKCPVLIIHADWYRSNEGLIGAMDDEDSENALELVPHADYVRLHTRHVTHSGSPNKFIELVRVFIEKNINQSY